MDKNNTQYTYVILFTKASEMFFSKHKDIKTKYTESIWRLLLGENPDSVDVKKIKGKFNCYYRMKIGDYRVIYSIIKEKIVVITTLYAGSRGDVYNKLNRI